MPRRAVLVFALALVVGVPHLIARQASAQPLEIYVVDTEGGKAVLWITPALQPRRDEQPHRFQQDVRPPRTMTEWGSGAMRQ